MPNQRSKTKVRLGCFLEKALYNQIIAMAIREGWGHNKFGFAMLLVTEEMDRRDRLENRRRAPKGRRTPKRRAS